MAKYKAYPEYKDSGVEWLGGVPEHWKTLAIKHVAQLNPSKSCISIEKMKGMCSFIPMEKLKFNSLSLDEVKYISDVYNGYTYFENEDIIIAKVTPCFENKNMVVAHDLNNGIGFGSSEIYVLRCNNIINNYFLFYRLQEDNFMSLAEGAMTGAGGLKRVPSEVLNNFKFGLPSKKEQSIIVDFLKHETAKIDNLIEKQQQLIELLKEKRQAVISHAVTKGLNPDVPMKDSGVEWLGEVPAHWGITKLKWVGRTTSGGTPTTSKFEIYYEDGHIPWIRTTDLSNGELFDTPIRITSKAVNDTACSILPVGSVLLGMYGGAGSIGKHAILRFESTINQAVCGVLPCARILPDYLHKYYEFYRPFWMVDAAGTRKDPNIGQDNIKEGIILIPPFEEQIEINNHIDIMRNIYECIIENALEGVGLLQERRTALISAAVTGKIDVRDWVAPNACEAEVSQEATA
ncbi:restriction endonuclease subunit S [Hafnia paralvei]|uniref:restriction endonuclease subunit S n=1 Tax=Hafnia paralvei TaxID=546367 RepID=UPI0024BACD65|nr:restriction endonuclease subunit S [Hafnia paralvei]